MIRIVGLQRNENPNAEFILLQNQGGLRVTLRGHMVMAERAIEDGLTGPAHIFSDDVQIPPGAFAILYSGVGEPRWAKTKDGAMVFYCYMGREEPVWLNQCAPIHVLSMHHTFTERREFATLR